MRFDGGKDAAQVPIKSIDAIFVGTEITQSGGKVVGSSRPLLSLHRMGPVKS